MLTPDPRDGARAKAKGFTPEPRDDDDRDKAKGLTFLTGGLMGYWWAIVIVTVFLHFFAVSYRSSTAVRSSEKPYRKVDSAIEPAMLVNSSFSFFLVHIPQSITRTYHTVNRR